MDFKDWFCLKDRESFTIDAMITPSDAQFYLGRADIKNSIVRALARSFVDPGVPKMVLHGAYGSGKTQTLYHIAHLLENDPPKSLKSTPHTVLAILEMGSKSTHHDWHLQLMEALSKDVVTAWVDDAFSKVKDWDAFLKMTLGDANLVQAVMNLRGVVIHP